MIRLPSGLSDFLGPRGDTLHLLLKRRDKVVAAIYKDDEQEIRSPSLTQNKEADEPPNHNS